MDILQTINLGTILLLLGGAISVFTFMNKRDKQLMKQSADFEAVKKDIEQLEKQLSEVKDQGEKNEKRLESKIDAIGNKLDLLNDKIFQMLKR